MNELLSLIIEDHFSSDELSMLKKLLQNSNKTSIAANDNDVLLELIKKNIISDSYVLIKENILNLLKYPRYLFVINEIYGPEIGKMFELILEKKYMKIDAGGNLEFLTEGKILEKKCCGGDEIVYVINYTQLNSILFKNQIKKYYRNLFPLEINTLNLLNKVLEKGECYIENYENNNDLFVYGNNTLRLNREKVKRDMFLIVLLYYVQIKYDKLALRLVKLLSQYSSLSSEDLTSILQSELSVIQPLLSKLISENIVFFTSDFYALNNKFNFDLITKIKMDFYSIVFELKTKENSWLEDGKSEEKSEEILVREVEKNERNVCKIIEMINILERIVEI